MPNDARMANLCRQTVEKGEEEEEGVRTQPRCLQPSSSFQSMLLQSAPADTALAWSGVIDLNEQMVSDNRNRALDLYYDHVT